VEIADELYGGRYRLLDRLGAGGMAVVHRARDKWLGREVAIKVIGRHLRQDMLAVRRFRREAKLGATLSHPNIVGVLGAGTEPHEFIVMELVAGQDAGRLLQQRGRQPTAAGLRIVAQVADALQYTHDRGVVHGDVSPGNVVIREDDGEAKLADFGVAQKFDARPTGPQDVVGTPTYMAPEVFKGAAPSPRSDLYSLAAVAQALLVPDLPPALADALQQALSPDPAKRQSSVAEFRAQATSRSNAPALLQVVAA
jgi:eukaryotic-like serine/threonine-protein kinase